MLNNSAAIDLGIDPSRGYWIRSLGFALLHLASWCRSQWHSDGVPGEVTFLCRYRLLGCRQRSQFNIHWCRHFHSRSIFCPPLQAHSPITFAACTLYNNNASPDKCRLAIELVAVTGVYECMSATSLFCGLKSYVHLWPSRVQPSLD